MATEMPANSTAAQWDRTVAQEEQIHAAAIPLKDLPSCMNLFDTWATCFALVPQIKSVYRHGAPNDCKPKLEDFKFCLTMKGLSDEERRATWIRRKAEITAAKRIAGSSEDVWELRADPVVNPETADPIPPRSDPVSSTATA